MSGHTYKIVGKRFLREYTEADTSPVYAAEMQAQRIVEEMCNVPWGGVAARSARMTYHTDEVVDEESKTTGLDMNVKIRDQFDAALFCAEHVGGQHRAYANAAVYHYTLPDEAVGCHLARLSAKVTSDPYNSQGARIHVITSSTGEIPTSCRTCRGEDSSGNVIEDGTTAAGVAPRTVTSSGGKDYWYPTRETVSLEPTGGLVLGKHLFLFVLMESYATVRGNWIEGSSFIDNLVEIETSESVSGWSDGEIYDLVEDSDLEYNVVKDGVYPDIVGEVSGVETMQLQRTGDPFVLHYGSTAPGGDGGLYKINGDSLSRLIGVDAGEITMVREVEVIGTDNNGPVFSYILIGGTFSGGTFSEIPGLYFYDMQLGRLCTSKSLNSDAVGGAVVPPALATFAKEHGGFEYVDCIYLGGNSGAAWVFVAKDGLTFSWSTTLNGQFCPCIEMAPIASNSLTFQLYPIEGNYTPYPRNLITSQGIDADEISVGAYYKEYATSGYVGKLRLHGCARVGNTLHLFISTFEVSSASTHPVTTALGAVSTLSVTGTVTSISDAFVYADPNGARFTVCGNLASVGGVSVKNCALLKLNNNGTAWTAVAPSFDNYITPDDYAGFRVVRGHFYGDDTNFYIAGGYSSLASNTSYSLLAKVAANGTTPTAISHPAGMTVPRIVAYLDFGAKHLLYVAATSATDMVYGNLHPSITDEQSAIGLRMLYAGLYRGKLDAVGVADVGAARPGALFVVRGDTLTVPGDSGTVSVKTWQLSLARLIVPFAVPTAFRATRIKLDWSSLDATDGAKLNVWIKRGEYIDEMPRLSDVALYDASKSAVSGWELVGTIDASATSATFTVAPLTGRCATLMFTAWISLDEENPASGMELPQGVGTANINRIGGEIENLDSGWRPDITLLP